MRKKKATVAADLATLGKVLKRVAGAADRNVPGIYCTLVRIASEDGTRYEVSGLGCIYVLEERTYLVNRSGQEVDLSLVPGIEQVRASLSAYEKREGDDREHDRRVASRRILRETADEVKGWRTSALSRAVRDEKRERARPDDIPGILD